MAETIVVRFRELYIASIVIFAASLVLIPINQLYSTLILFGLIGLWTRIPTFFSDFLKDLEQVDFLTIMIAIHIGGFIGGVFGMVVMLFSRIFAPLEWPLYTLKDSICFLIGGMLVPAFYGFFGGNLLMTAYTFTAFRYLFYLFLTLFIESDAFFLEVGILAASAPIAFLVNTGAITLFAPLIEPILKRGIGFNIELIITVLIILSLAAAAQYLNKKYGHKLKKKGREIVEPAVVARRGIHS